jgi:hypothetical protein
METQPPFIESKVTRPADRVASDLSPTFFNLSTIFRPVDRIVDKVCVWCWGRRPADDPACEKCSLTLAFEDLYGADVDWNAVRRANSAKGRAE